MDGRFGSSLAVCCVCVPGVWVDSPFFWAWSLSSGCSCGVFFSESSRAGFSSSSGIAAVWVSASGGPGSVPVTMSASQSPRPPGAASTAVWGL